jgi:CP family cyanate transporter-like MFS transporter
MLAFAGRLVRRHSTYVAMGGLLVASVVGIVAGNGVTIVYCAAVLGFANAVALVLMLALPALLGAPEDVHRMSAAMFTISYPCAVVLPILGGLAWDVTGVPALAFAPVGLGALMILALSPGLKLGESDLFLATTRKAGRRASVFRWPSQGREAH